MGSSGWRRQLSDDTALPRGVTVLEDDGHPFHSRAVLRSLPTCRWPKPLFPPVAGDVEQRIEKPKRTVELLALEGGIDVLGADERELEDPGQ